MVELESAPIASATVFRELLHMSVTKLAVELILVFRKVLVGDPGIPLLLDNRITWVHHSGQVGHPRYSEVHEEKEGHECCYQMISLSLIINKFQKRHQYCKLNYDIETK